MIFLQPNVRLKMLIIAAVIPTSCSVHSQADFISSLLSKLSLREKLSKNKEIEDSDQNKNRDLKNYNHHMIIWGA